MIIKQPTNRFVFVFLCRIISSSFSMYCSSVTQLSFPSANSSAFFLHRVWADENRSIMAVFNYLDTIIQQPTNWFVFVFLCRIMYRRCESEEFFVIRNFKGVCKLCSVLKNYSFCFFITPTMFIRTSDIFISYQKYQRQRSVSEEFLYYTNQQFFEHHRHPNECLLVTCVNTCVNASFFTPSRMNATRGFFCNDL